MTSKSNKVRKRRRLTVQKQRYIGAYLFLAPQILVFFGLSLYPIIMSYVYSFYNWDGASPLTDFIGFGNYLELFNFQRFWAAFGHTLLYVVGTTIFSVSLSLLLAIILSAENFEGKAFYRTIYFLPVVTTTAIIGIIMSNIFGLNGFVNNFLRYINLITRPIPWLTSSTLAMFVLIAVGVWKSLGTNMIYWLAGLQSIPGTLYESAQLDGAGFWQVLRHITLPLLRPVFSVIMLLSIVSGMHVFDLVKTLTDGGPYYSTETLDLFVFNYAFGGGVSGITARMGFASAAGVLLGVFTLLVSLIFGGMSGYLRRKTNNESEVK